jgi:hypothetical protein
MDPAAMCGVRNSVPLLEPHVKRGNGENARPNEVVAETRCLGHQVNSLDVVPAGSWALRDAGGSRTHLDRVAAGCRAVWLQRRCVSVLARN